ncbi:MAG: universal stress protein [Nitrososphaeraceae archaeon]
MSFALARINLPQKTEEHDSTKEQKFGHIPIGFPSFERILVAYDGTEMSKRALSYAAYISKISDSEIIIVNVVEANRDVNNVLPVTIKANLEGKEEQIDMAESQRGVLLDEPLREVVDEMTTACKSAGVTMKITYEIRRGNPADEIINVSNLMQFDLIVMGSRRIASMIGGIGSTTRKVLTTVKAPLLIVQKQRTYKDEY